MATIRLPRFTGCGADADGYCIHVGTEHASRRTDRAGQFEDQIALFSLVDRLAVGLIGLEGTGRNSRGDELLLHEFRDWLFVPTAGGDGQEFEQQLFGRGSRSGYLLSIW